MSNEDKFEIYYEATRKTYGKIRVNDQTMNRYEKMVGKDRS